MLIILGSFCLVSVPPSMAMPSVPQDFSTYTVDYSTVDILYFIQSNQKTFVPPPPLSRGGGDFRLENQF
jgi:hypothetical protein